MNTVFLKLISRFTFFALIPTFTFSSVAFSGAFADTFTLPFEVTQPFYVVVPEKQVLQELAQAPAIPLASGISILVWNTQKGEGKENWAWDFRNLAKGKQLVFLQEGMNDNFMPSILRSMPDLGWLMAQNFYMKDSQDATGVITGHTQSPLSTVFKRTKDTEPITNTPKMTLFTTYVMEKGTRILVVNIHGINFTSLFPFYHQIDQVTELIKKWHGKVIFAGDFNTWAPGRTEYLSRKAQEAGLIEVAVNSTRSLVLDHIFVRGCYPYRAEIHDEINSSDHKPLTADLVCPE